MPLAEIWVRTPSCLYFSMHFFWKWHMSYNLRSPQWRQNVYMTIWIRPFGIDLLQYQSVSKLKKEKTFYDNIQDQTIEFILKKTEFWLLIKYPVVLLPSLILYDALSLTLSCLSWRSRKSWASCNQLQYKKNVVLLLGMIGFSPV